jgi:hypothetical protein
MRIAILSDTHGLLRPEVLPLLAGADHILHAGDTGTPEVLEAIRAYAPLTIVRGNVDRGPWAAALPATALAELGGLLFYLIHDLADLDLDPAAAGIHAVVYGHSHQPRAELRGGVHYLNPGSAGPRRFSLPITMMDAQIQDGVLSWRLVDLAPR